ncbi:hypothetical protein TGARI_257650 [Toxoplasma gondii ARI]|uniref:Uncharacterized protein n=1 Tax=Toxoplasma gondii ARI TaxID=1074872 RepID=A0A139Y411_TOXGO|nr:hypothetical protein TGARI_257650 [Toxoplasma gondii ARI]
MAGKSLEARCLLTMKRRFVASPVCYKSFLPSSLLSSLSSPSHSAYPPSASPSSSSSSSPHSLSCPPHSLSSPFSLSSRSLSSSSPLRSSPSSSRSSPASSSSSPPSPAFPAGSVVSAFCASSLAAVFALPGALSGLGRDRLWACVSSRSVSFKNRAEWRAFMRLPPKSRVEPRRPIPRIFPWRMAHNPLPRRYPLYKHRTLFLPLSLPSYSPQPAISGVAVAPLTITTNAAQLPRTLLLQSAVRQLRPLSAPQSPSPSSPQSSPSQASSEPSFPLNLPGVLREGGLRRREGARSSSWLASLATSLQDDAAQLAGQCFPSASPNISRPASCAFAGTFLAVYSSDEFPAICVVREALGRVAPGVRLALRQEAGEGLLKIFRDDGMAVFVKDEVNRLDRTRKTALAKREAGRAAVQSILLACGVAVG